MNKSGTGFRNMTKKPFFIFFLLALVIPFCWSAGADSG